MAELKNAWKQTAKSFIIAMSDLGGALVNTAKAGKDKAIKWAHTDNEHIEAEGTEIPEEKAE